MERLDTVVVGAGVVGLAIARELARTGRDVVVLEAEPQIGMHSSSRNSEVIHAGIYYPTDSLKASLCVRGKEMLYEYCVAHDIGHRQIGKLIVATNESDLAKLDAIEKQARKNGVGDLRGLNKEEVTRLEPAIRPVGALFSPSTGIVDSHELMVALQAAIEEQGGVVVLNSRVENIISTDNGIQFEVGGDIFLCKTLVNAAGLGAQALVSDLCGATGSVPAMYPAKGHYFSYQGRSPFNHLVYPVPSGGGLGIHATNDLSGAARFGPDVTWVDTIDYNFDESRKPDFVTAIRRYFPALDEEKLVPAYTGIRPKLSGPGESAADFVIQGESDHGVPGLVNLFGIESPGLTASLAIGEYVEHLLA